MTQFYAYIYRDPSRNFQPIYAGKGQDDRAYDHLKNRDKPKKKENKSFMGRLRNMKEAGVEPVIQIFNCESEELAFLFEEEAIDKYGRIDLGKGPLHNHTNGGEGVSGHIDSPETRKKKSDAQKGENNPMYGKIASPETRKKKSDAMKGKNTGKSHSLETRKNISDALKGENNPNYGKSPSAEARKNMSDAQKGENNPMYGKSHSLETRAKISAAASNPSLETRKKQSDAHKGKVQPKSICPRCGKLSGPSRWHFDSCKYRK